MGEKKNCPTTPNKYTDKKSHLLNNLLNNSKRTYIIKSFSVRQKKLPILMEFEEIAKREAGSRGFSEVVVHALEEYNQRHRIGNPQIPLTKFSGEPKVKTNCYCGELATYEVWAENGWHGYLCSQDFTRSRDAGLLKRWRKLI